MIDLVEPDNGTGGHSPPLPVTCPECGGQAWVDSERLYCDECPLVENAPSVSSPLSSSPTWRPFRLDAFPPKVRRFVSEAAAAIGCDPALLALPAVVALAGCIGNRRRVRLKTSWEEPAVLWGVVVAPSGKLKSPAIDEVLRPLRRREAELIEAYRLRREAFERELQAWSDTRREQRGERPQPPEPPERLIVSDATVEALALRLSESPAGLALWRDELAAWFRSFGQYKSGRGGDAQAYLEMHRAGALLVDRKAGGTLSVQRAAVSIVGGVQPSVLRATLAGEHMSDGLAARFLFVMPPTGAAKRWTEADLSAEARLEWSELLESLLGLPYTGEPVDLALTREARELFITYYDEHADREAETESETLAAALAKLEGGAARFALVVALASDPHATVIDAASMRAGIRLARWFRNEAARVYQTFTERPEEHERRKLVEWIAANCSRCTVRELRRCGPRRYRDQAAAREALDDLVAAGFGVWVEAEPGPGGGRPSRVFVLGDGDTGDTTSGPVDCCSGDKTSETSSAAGVATGDETSKLGDAPGSTVAVATVAIAESDSWEDD